MFQKSVYEVKYKASYEIGYIYFIKEREEECFINNNMWTVEKHHFNEISILLSFHRSLLTARSAYFEAMLSGSWAESDSHEIKLEG